MRVTRLACVTVRFWKCSKARVFRRLEVINLLVQDVAPERDTLFVRQGKGKADRMGYGVTVGG